MALYLKRIQFKSEVEEVKKMFLSIFPEEKYHVDDCIEAFEDSIIGNDIDRQLDYYLVENDDGETIGLTGIYAQNRDEAWLGWFGILPKYRNNGLGRKVLTRTLELMRVLGYTTMRLYSDPMADVYACELYASMGFVMDSKYDEKTITMKYDLIGSGHFNKTIPDWKGKPYGM